MSIKAAPPLCHPDRARYEAAYRNGNDILRTSLVLDEAIRHLQSRMYHTPFDLHNRLQQLEAEVTITLQQAERRGTSSWNEFYRLMSQTTFLEQRVMMPLVAEQVGAPDACANLANGIYGLNTHILELELAEYTNPHTLVEREELRGAINEQTYSGLIHRPQDGLDIALPSATTDDLDNRIDVDHWHFSEDTQSFIHIPVQIKSSVSPRESHLRPKDGIVITAADMSNNYNFRATHLMIKEHNEGLTITEVSELAAIQQQLTMIIDTKYNALNRQ
jgi:hypothetical protein